VPRYDIIEQVVLAWSVTDLSTARVHWPVAANVTHVVSMSLAEDQLPASQRRAVVTPRLKKLGLDAALIRQTTNQFLILASCQKLWNEL